MKLSGYAFKRFWDVHAWAGVVTSLVVYVMFVLGAVTLFYEPLTVWEEPIEQRAAPPLSSLGAPLTLAEPLPEEFYYYLPEEGRGLPKVAYFLPDTTSWRAWWLDVEGARSIPQRALAAAYIYDLHYLWHEMTGYWLQYGAGILVFGFLLAIVTGVLIHFKGLLSQLWRFRPESKPRVASSDLHKVTGVFGLPFQLVYALTGTMMALAPVMFTISVEPVFGGDEARAVQTAGALIEDPPPRDYGPPASPLSLDELVQRARHAEPRLTPESFVFRGYQRAEGTVDVRGPIDGYSFGDGVVRLRAVDGRIEHVVTPEAESAVGTLARWIHGLHTIEYGGMTARFLVFGLAIAGCITILSGNWVWLARRETRSPTFGNTLLARLTAGVGAGTLVAVAAMLFASRLLSLELEGRAAFEELTLACAFFVSVGYAASRRDTRATWCHLLGVAASLLLLVPIAARGHSEAGLFGAGPHDAVVVGVDVGLLVSGLLLACLCWVLTRGWHQLGSRGTRPQQLRPASVASGSTSLRSGSGQ